MGKPPPPPSPPPPVCNDDYSYFSRLPDDIVLLIFNKILDLKTLCLCTPVSTKFNLMVRQVDTVSFVASPADKAPPRLDVTYYYADDDDFLDELPEKLLYYLSKPFYRLAPGGQPVPPASFDCESFRSAIQSMGMFTRLKSLCIELSSTRQDVVGCGPDFYKWKVKFGGKLESLVFLSPDSVCELSKNVSGEEEEEEEDQRSGTDLIQYLKLQLAFDCLMEAAVRFRMLLGCTIDFPLLEKVLIMQSGKRGSVSISGRNNIVEMREWLRSPPALLERKLRCSRDLPKKYSVCYVPLLKLPVSGYLMKGVSLITMQRTSDLLDGDDSFFMNINLDDIEDKQEAAYGEAVMEMLKICRRDLLNRAA